MSIQCVNCSDSAEYEATVTATGPNGAAEQKVPMCAPCMRRGLLELAEVLSEVHVALNERKACVRVVHCKRDPYDVYIGRPSKWGNPFPLPKGYDVHADPDRILARYEEHVRSRPELMAALPELRGKVLGCWCAPKPCHGDVLARLVLEAEVSRG